VKTMAEVLREHFFSLLNEGGWYCFKCQSDFTDLAAATKHQADALTAAGFGLVKEAQAAALQAAADILPNPSDGWGMNQREWLNARAASIEGEA
jgi:hypothetical protein